MGCNVGFSRRMGVRRLKPTLHHYTFVTHSFDFKILKLGRLCKSKCLSASLSFCRANSWHCMFKNSDSSALLAKYHRTGGSPIQQNHPCKRIENHSGLGVTGTSTYICPKHNLPWQEEVKSSPEAKSEKRRKRSRR